MFHAKLRLLHKVRLALRRHDLGGVHHWLLEVERLADLLILAEKLSALARADLSTVLEVDTYLMRSLGPCSGVHSWTSRRVSNEKL